MSKARDLANAGTALTNVSATELGYLDGVTSAVQTQIDSKIGQSTAINPTIVTTKGDLIAATGASTPARLAVGSNDQVLTADSTAATGMKWATVAGGGMTLISTTTLSGVTTTLSSIPQTYTNLFLVVSGMTGNTANSQFRLTPNNTASVCDYFLGRSNATPSNNQNSSIVFDNFANTDRTNANNVIAINFYNYTSSTRYKPFDARGFLVTGALNNSAFFIGGNFSSNTAITSLVFDYGGTNTFASGTVLLYGVK